MPQRTPRPKITGTQSALVVGKEGEEIDVDEQGRIRVSSTGIARRRRRAEFASRNSGPGSNAARCTCRASAMRSWSHTTRAIRTGRWSSARSTTGRTRCRRRCPPKRRTREFSRDRARAAAATICCCSRISPAASSSSCARRKTSCSRRSTTSSATSSSSQTEKIGGDETINVGFPVPPRHRPGSGNFTLNALNKVTINVGPQGSPMTQLIMDTQSITLNVGPGGAMSQIVMNQTSIRCSRQRSR